MTRRAPAPRTCSTRYDRKGLPFTGRRGLGTSPGTDCRRVPWPPARITTSRPLSASGIAVRVGAEDLIGADQFADPVVERVARLEARLLDLLVGDDVVALVGVLAHRRLEEREAGGVGLDLLAE